MKFPAQKLKPLNQNLLKLRFASLNNRSGTKRQTSIKLVKRYCRLIK